MSSITKQTVGNNTYIYESHSFYCAAGWCSGVVRRVLHPLMDQQKQ